MGLPPGQMGNSEVGHLNLGAGRPVLQDLPRIDAAIADGTFFERPALVAACERAAQASGRLHIVSLVGPGGVHANDRHVVALAELAARRGVPSVRLHALLDGRDTPPRSAIGFVRDLEAPPGRGPPGCPDRHDRRTLLRDGPRQALGTDSACLRRDRPRGGGAGRLGDRGDRARLRARRERRVRRPDGHRRRRRTAAATAIRWSSRTSGPIVPASSRTPSSMSSSRPSIASASVRGRATSSW